MKIWELSLVVLPVACESDPDDRKIADCSSLTCLRLLEGMLCFLPCPALARVL